MQSELSRLDDPGVQATNPFWADRARARAFAVLRLRVERVPAALQYCHWVLGGIFSDFYPLQVVPSSMETLCRMFSQPEELHRVVNHQIHAGLVLPWVWFIVTGRGSTLLWRWEVLRVVGIIQWKSTMLWLMSMRAKL